MIRSAIISGDGVTQDWHYYWLTKGLGDFTFTKINLVIGIRNGSGYRLI